MIAILLKFWKPIALVIAALLIIGLVRNAWNEHGEQEYKRGKRETEEAQAEVLAKRALENEKRERELTAIASQKQTELEGQIYATELVADSLRAQLRGRRVCLDEVRSGPVPTSPSATEDSNGATSDQRPVETVGDAIVEIVAECQRSTDKLITLQDWVRITHEAGL